MLHDLYAIAILLYIFLIVFVSGNSLENENILEKKYVQENF